MAKTRRVSRRMIAITAVVWVALASVILAPAASAAPDYGSLTARWWQWIYAQRTVDVANTNTNPVLDTTGQFAASGQEAGIGPADKYFFLAGNFGGKTVRSVSVPSGKTLLFPIYNFEADNAVDPPTNHTVPELKKIASGNIDTFTHSSATLDGAPIATFRSTTPVFGYTLPDQDSIYDYLGLVGPQFEGRIKPAVADGYWAVLEPTQGFHVLHFTAYNPTFPFTLDVTYNLTIQ